VQAGQRRTRNQLERDCKKDLKYSQRKKRQKRSVCSHNSASQNDNRSAKGSKIESMQNESSVDNTSLNGCVYLNSNSNKSVDVAKQSNQHRSRNQEPKQKSQKSQKSSTSKKSANKMQEESPVQQSKQNRTAKASQKPSPSGAQLQANEQPAESEHNQSRSPLHNDQNHQMLQEIQSLRSLLAQKDTELQKKSQILEMYAQKLPEQQAVIEKQAS